MGLVSKVQATYANPVKSVCCERGADQSVLHNVIKNNIDICQDMSSESASPVPSKTFSNASHDASSRSLKRKAAEVDDQPPLSKRAQKKKKSKRTADESSLYTEVGEGQFINPTVGQMDGHLIADYIGRQIKRFEPDLSSIEFEERRIPGTTRE